MRFLTDSGAGSRDRAPRTRRLIAASIAAFVLLVPAIGSAQVKALRFGKLWTGTGPVLTDAVVIVDGSRIVRVGTGRAPIPAGAEVVDLTRFMGIPGLIDVHTHMTYYWDRQAGTPPRAQRRHPAVTVVLAQENARKTLEAGVTTVRDLNAAGDLDMAMRDLIDRGAMLGPRMFVSGQGLSTRRGTALGVEAVRKLAEERIKAGDDWVKLFASTGGFENVSEDQTLTYAEIKAAVDATHALRKRIAVHSYGPGGGRDAVRAGADSVEHAVDLDEATLEEMARRGIFYVPTIDHNRYYIDAKDEYQFAPGVEAPLEAYIERNLETARRAHKAGVRFAMGSDAVYSMFGQNTRELGWFVKAGMTPAQALTSATINGAALLGLEERLGTIAAGFVADLVAVEGDPSTDISALFTGVRWVMKDGAVVVNKIGR